MSNADKTYLTDGEQFCEGFFIQPISLNYQVIPQNGDVSLRASKGDESEWPECDKDFPHASTPGSIDRNGHVALFRFAGRGFSFDVGFVILGGGLLHDLDSILVLFL